MKVHLRFAALIPHSHYPQSKNLETPLIQPAWMIDAILWTLAESFGLGSILDSSHF